MLSEIGIQLVDPITLLMDAMLELFNNDLDCDDTSTVSPVRDIS